MKPSCFSSSRIVFVFNDKHFIKVICFVATTYIYLKLLLRESLASLYFIFYDAVENKEFGSTEDL